MISFDTPIEDLTGVGKTIASRLKRLHLHTVKDLIFYLPFRYDDLSRVVPISDFPVDQIGTIQGIIELIESRNSPQKRTLLTEAIVSDDSGSIKVIWFNQRFLTKTFQAGDKVYLSGRVKGDSGNLQFVSPVIEKVKQDTLHTARIVPVYPLTEHISQKQIRFLIKQSLSVLPRLLDWLPAFIQKEQNLETLHWSIQQIHFPDTNENLQKAVKRLKFSELFLLQLKIILSKKEFSESTAPKISFSKTATNAFVQSLPFELTSDQKKVTWQVLKDISQPHPANRLIEGEVGSGKTVVMAIVFLNVSASGYQSVFMAPTEILAHQHYDSLQKFFKDSDISVALLTRTESRLDFKKISKPKLLKKIADRKVDVIVGTHALISGNIQFKNLGLVLVDEQHRFGVEQRRVLKELSGNDDHSPHFISMTATPIPRTLSLVFYGDLKVSQIKEMPKQRKKIITKISLPDQQSEVYEFIRKEVKQGRQAFVICPLIDPSDFLGVKSVAEEYERLQKEIFPELKIDFLHGKLKSADKESRMKDFSNGKSDILVSTSVVEVGVDVPNASVMIIERAIRFGLSQLHQFRGRVGRSKHQSYCFLFTEKATQSKKRLDAFVTAKDCFELAELDLDLRGPGQMFGSAQSGFSDLKVATFQDWQLANSAKKQAQKLLEHPHNMEKFPLLAKKIKSELTLAHFE